MLYQSDYWLPAVASFIILGWILWKKSRPSRPYVIGGQMANALRAEHARLSDPRVGPSPLPAGLQYDRWRGDLDVSNPVKQPLDEELSGLCQRFAASNPLTRSRLRGSASLEDFYTLLTFSQRSAVFAMRDRGAEHIVAGLTAVALIEKDRIDFRDALGALSLLHHAAGVVRIDPAPLFAKAASLAESKMSELILGFLKRSEDGRDIQKSWGYTVIETKAGPGFIECGFEPYEPTYPLAQIGLALAELIKRDKYQPTSVTVASDLPAVWLSSVDDGVLENALQSVRAAVTINADLRPQESADSHSQVLIIFLVELRDEAAASSLFRLSEEKRNRANRFAIAAAKEERLFSLAVERSFVAGEASFETSTAMQRFANGMAEVLRGYTRR